MKKQFTSAGGYMIGKAEISFIFLWVLNPIFILFYQNCSSVTSAQSKFAAAAPIEQRAPAAAYKPACHAGHGSYFCAE